MTRDVRNHQFVTIFARVIMCDVKDALPVLCKYINSLINVGLTAEHLRLAKYNTSDENTVSTAIYCIQIFSYIHIYNLTVTSCVTAMCFASGRDAMEHSARSQLLRRERETKWHRFSKLRFVLIDLTASLYYLVNLISLHFLYFSLYVVYFYLRLFIQCCVNYIFRHVVGSEIASRILAISNDRILQFVAKK